MYGRFELSCAIEVAVRNAMQAVKTASMNFPKWFISSPGRSPLLLFATCLKTQTLAEKLCTRDCPRDFRLHLCPGPKRKEIPLWLEPGDAAISFSTFVSVASRMDSLRDQASAAIIVNFTED